MHSIKNQTNGGRSCLGGERRSNERNPAPHDFIDRSVQNGGQKNAIQRRSEFRRHVTPRTIQPLGLGFLYSVVKILKWPTGVHRPPSGLGLENRRYVGKLPRAGAERSGNGARAERDRGGGVRHPAAPFLPHLPDPPCHLALARPVSHILNPPPDV